MDICPNYRVLDLFSGYGGFALGLRLAGLDATTVAYVEWDPFCQRHISGGTGVGNLGLCGYCWRQLTRRI